LYNQTFVFLYSLPRSYSPTPMQGHKHFVDKVVLRFRLPERVPKQNLYRRLGELLDWDFLYEQTRALYSHTGQPSFDPVVIFKLMLVSRLENLVSDRRLIEHCSLRLDILYFLSYELRGGREPALALHH
jgi:transposase